MPIDPGLAALKKSGLICPFVTTPEQYGLEAPPEIPFFCWFKTENLTGEGRLIDPLFAECPFTADFEACPIYQTNTPPL